MNFLDACVGAGIVLVSALIGSFIEPMHRTLGRLGRRNLHDIGVDIHIESDPAIIWAGTPPWVASTVFIPGQDAVGSPPDDARSWLRWAQKHGGCAAQESVIEITLVGKAPVTVVLSAVQVTAKRVGQATGHFLARPVGGAEISPRQITVDLDQFGLINPLVDMGTETFDSERMPKAWSLAKGDVEVFQLRVRMMSDQLVTWHAKIPMLIDGRRHFLDIDNDGAPFRLAGWPEGRDEIWTSEGWVSRHAY